MAKTYPIGVNLDDRALAEALTDFLESRDMTVQNISIAGNQWLVQAVGKGAGKPVPGLSRAVSIRLSLDGQSLEVEIGLGEWLDKVAGPAVNWQETWPAMVAAGIGANWQPRLPDEVYRFIEDWIRHPASVAPWPGAAEEAADTDVAADDSKEQEAVPELPAQDLPPEALSAAEASAAAGQIVPDGSSMPEALKDQESSP